MSLVDVVLDLRELLHCPLAHIDQGLYLVSRIGIQSGQSLGQFLLELTVVVIDKMHHVYHYFKAPVH